MENIKRRVIIVALAMAWMGVCWAIFDVGIYGWAFLFHTPFFMGFGSSVGYGWFHPEALGKSLRQGLLAFVVFFLALWTRNSIGWVLAIPLLFLFTGLGTWLGYIIVHRYKRISIPVLLLVMWAIPFSAWIETGHGGTVHEVRTIMEVNADQREAWNIMLAHPPMEKPMEWIYGLGIPYPVQAKTFGEGKGVKYQHVFSKGTLDGQTVIWSDPRIMQVALSPESPSTLYVFFTLQREQFSVIPLALRKAEVEIITWYFQPEGTAFYWKVWGDYIVRKNHQSTLGHIKSLFEK